MAYKYAARDENVTRHREYFLSRHNIDIDQCVVMDVEHSDRIASVDSSYCDAVTRGTTSPIAADALTTDEEGVCLFLLTADCLPVAVFDPVQKAIALVHLGWQSTDQDLAAKTIDHLTKTYGSRLDGLLIDIGPAIHARSYVKQKTAQLQKPAWTPYLTNGDQGYHVDLIRYNYDALRSCGVPVDRITVSDRDTARDEHFFSHYNAARGNEPEGRFATILMMQRA